MINSPLILEALKIFSGVAVHKFPIGRHSAFGYWSLERIKHDT
jgi:hypothetical protein